MADLPEILLRKILGDFDGYMALNERGHLTFDGYVDLNPDEVAWTETFWEEMEPVYEAQTRAYWEKWIPEYVDRALAGDTEARERLIYFATRGGEPQATLAREALRAHNLDSTV